MLLGSFFSISRHKALITHYEMEAIRGQQSAWCERQRRRREYLDSLPRYNGKSIVPIVPLETQNPPRTESGGLR